MASAVGDIQEYKSGAFYQDDFRGNASWNGNERNVMLRNAGLSATGVPQLADVAVPLGADDTLDARGMATADFDNDGDLDIVVNHNPGANHDSIAPKILRNDLVNECNWLTIELVGTTSNRDAVGAIATIKYETEAGMQLATRHVGAGSGYASQNGMRLHFGFGSGEIAIQELTIRWPSGLIETYHGLKDRRQRFVEGEASR